jgi:hypothetical protein
MVRLGRLGRWWWRWLIGWAILAAIGLLAVLILPLTGLLPRPSVLGSLPAPGASDLPPRSEITLRFSTPMDRSSVEDATRLEPAQAGAWRWPDRQTAIWRPEPAWASATTYTLSLDTQAQSLLRQSLAAPFSLTFSIAPAPVLTFRTPAPNTLVPAHAPLVLRFDRPILPTERITDTALPALSITPPVSATARWYDERTVVVLADFAPAATYTATLAGLVDVVGSAVEVAPWSFHTAAPALTAAAPLDRQRITPSQPLSLTFAGALSPAAVELITRSFQLQPPLTATWQILPAPGQRPQTTLLLSPTAGWTPRTTYTATLALPNRDVRSWRWQVDPELVVLGTVPGRNGTLAPDAELRLILSTDLPDADLARRLTIEPAVAALTISHSGAQLRITGDFAPSSAYTLTLRDGASPLFELPFRTGGPSRSLAIAAPAAPMSLWAPGETPQVGLALSGLAQVSVALYPLDRPLLTTLLLNPDLPFTPERYGRSPDRVWAIESDGGRDWQTSVAITGTAAGAPLAGGYLVLASDGRGLAAQHLLIVSPYRISASANPTTLDVWTLDSRTRQPAPELPLLVLRGNSQLAEGRTGPDGRWQTAIPPAVGKLLILGGTDAEPVVGSIQQTVARSGSIQVNAMLDRAHYRPGETVRLAGSVANLPAGSPTLEIALVASDDQTRLTGSSQRLTAATFEAALPIRAGYGPGKFDIELALDGRTVAILPFAVDPPAPATPELRIAPSITPGGTLRADIALPATAKRSAAGGVGQWSVAAAGGQILGSGSFNADRTGVGSFALPLAADLAPGQLRVSVAAAGSTASAAVEVVPDHRLSLDCERRLVQPNELIPLVITLQGSRGEPLANTAVEVAIGGDVAPSLLRRTTDASGRASIQWRVPGSGRFDISARSAAAVAPPLTIWASRPNFSGWAMPTDGSLPLALERERLLPGQPIRLLPLLPAPGGLALVTWSTDERLESLTIPWKAGLPISLTLPLSVTGRVNLAVALATEGGGRLALYNGTAALEVLPAAPIALAIESIQPLQISTRSQSGAPIASPLQLVVREANATGALWPPDGSGRVAFWMPRAATDATGLLTIPLALPPSRFGWEVTVLSGASSASRILPAQPSPDLDVAAPERLLAGDSATATLRLQSPVEQTALVRLEAQPGVTLAITSQQISLLPNQPAYAEWPLAGASPQPGLITVTLALSATTSAISQPLAVLAAPLSQRLVLSKTITSTQTLSWSLPLAADRGEVALAVAPQLSDLRRAALGDLLADPTLLGAAGRIALGASAPLTATLASDIADLRGAQGTDGGWSWAGGRSDALLTAQIVRLLARAPANPSLEPMLNHATAWLETQRSAEVDADTSALILAALGLRGSNVSAASISLLNEKVLLPSSRFLLIATLYDLRPSQQAAAYLQQWTIDPAPWTQPERAWDGSTHAAALLAELLLRHDPDHPLLGAAIRSIIENWRGAGWGDAVTTTEALLVLDALPASARPAQSYRVRQNGTSVYNGSAAWSATLPLTTTPLTLTVESQQELPFAAQLGWIGGVRPATALLVFDQGPAGPLRVGERGEWHLSLVLLEPLPYIQLHLAGPAGLTIDGVESPALLGLGAGQPGQSAFLDAGVYPITVYGRADQPGRFAWPLPSLTSAGRSINLNGPAQALTVQP